jgi:hypothetical protein
MMGAIFATQLSDEDDGLEILFSGPERRRCEPDNLAYNFRFPMKIFAKLKITRDGREESTKD